MPRLRQALLPQRALPKHLSEWAELGIEVDYCPACERAPGQYHFRSCPRRAGFVRPDKKRCIFCKAPAGSQHKQYQGEPCPNWF